ncbi:MAG: FAD:protein FMN transferase [Intestinimonas sp.]
MGVKDPRNTETYFCILSLSDKTCSTSGSYERKFEVDGTTYHHILDPATGYPAESGLLSVTAVSSDGMLAGRSVHRLLRHGSGAVCPALEGARPGGRRF